MKKIISQMRFRTILPLLVMAVLLTLPSLPTGSKYVWENTIDVGLKVIYPNTAITSLLPEGNPSEFWVQDLTNIQATPTADGLVLTATEGYTMPESITVKIGQTIFSVNTDGTKPLEGITFDATSGLLSISESLINENPGGVTVSAVAVQKSNLDEGKSLGNDELADDNKVYDNYDPSGNGASDSESNPAGENVHIEEGSSVDEGAYTGEELAAGNESTDEALVISEE